MATTSSSCNGPIQNQLHQTTRCETQPATHRRKSSKINAAFTIPTSNISQPASNSLWPPSFPLRAFASSGSAPQMENFRSQSCSHGRNMDMRSCSYKPGGMRDLRSYSTSYAKSPPPPPPAVQELQDENAAKMKKDKGNFGSTKSWVFSDPELQRKKRVASYKGYALEGKVKGSFRKSFRWVKHSCCQVVHAWK